MISNDDKDRGSNIPDHNPSKAMDSKKEVAQSPDAKTDQDFPGYPHYPAKEDMMDNRSGAHRVDAQVEDFGTAPNRTGVSQRFFTGESNNPTQATEDRSGSADALSAMDTTNEEQGTPQDVTNADLNAGQSLPGTDLSKAEKEDEGR